MTLNLPQLFKTPLPKSRSKSQKEGGQQASGGKKLTLPLSVKEKKIVIITYPVPNTIRRRYKKSITPAKSEEAAVERVQPSTIFNFSLPTLFYLR